MNGCSRCKPDIQYPCRWQYRLIGEERTTILQAVQAVVNLEACTVSDGNVSSGGRYLSVNVELTVTSEEDRLDLYNRFAADPAIRMVL
ncbi:MAG: DUF493 domain-containing protein [Desulfobulbus sp.]|nr:DUF493 domain-containing protein [Desulfobulbus sp.]